MLGFQNIRCEKSALNSAADAERGQHDRDGDAG